MNNLNTILFYLLILFPFQFLEAIVTVCPSTVFTTQEIIDGITTLQTRIPTAATTRITTIVTTTVTTGPTTTSLGACSTCDPNDITIDLTTSPFAVPFSGDSTELVNGCLVRTLTCTSQALNGVVIISVSGVQPQDQATVEGMGSVSVQIVCDEDAQWGFQVDPNDPNSMFVVTTLMCEDLQ